MNELLNVQNLKVIFPTERGIVRAVEGIDLCVHPGECIAIVGESGCGKDGIVKYAHEVSTRKNKPFLKINCAYLTEDLVSAELFGSGSCEQGLLQRAALLSFGRNSR